MLRNPREVGLMGRPKKSQHIEKTHEKHAVHDEKSPAEEKMKTLPAKKLALLPEIKPENHFVLCDGKIVKNYIELTKQLETMKDDVFYYHVTGEKNDFANWINDVFKEEQLANDLRASKSRIEMIALLYKNLFEKAERLLGT